MRYKNKIMLHIKTYFSFLLCVQLDNEILKNVILKLICLFKININLCLMRHILRPSLFSIKFLGDIKIYDIQI
jgi:hypothetical protein